MFIASYASTAEGESYILRLNSFRNDTTNETVLQRYVSGTWVDEREVKNDDTFSIGNVELGIHDIRINSGDKSAKITANSSNTRFDYLYSDEGLRVYLPFSATGTIGGSYNNVTGAINFTAGSGNNTATGHNGTNWYLTMAEEDKDGNLGSGDSWNISLGWDAGTTQEPEVSDLIGEDVTAVEIGDTDVWRSFMYSALATEFLWNKPSSGQDSMKIVYHGNEVAAGVFITSPKVDLVPGELGDVLVKDTEVSSVATKNLIVVGGSCINSAAATLVGGAYCGSAWTSSTNVGSGQFLIKGYADSTLTSKMALLVAGYEAADTGNAGTYLRTQVVDTSKEYTGTSGTQATLVVA
jgi:hypothetical protein